MQPSKTKRIPGGIKALIAGLLVVVLISAAGIGILIFSPSAAANGAEVLRQIIGDQNVAALETALFQTQDAIKQVEYHLGLLKPDNPFGQPSGTAGFPSGSADQASGSGSSQGAGGIALPPLSAPLATLQGLPAAGKNSQGNQGSAKTPDIRIPAKPLGDHSAESWSPPPVNPLGSQPGEGQWQAYIQDASGKSVAYRTFVQPDPQRPYVLTGVIAFDLNSVRLHYVIGFQEPYAPGAGPKQPGRIPAPDAGSEALLAAFNGGFKYEHGHFGSMSGGFTSAPPRDGLGVVAIYRDGSVWIGQWGKDIQDSPGLAAFRQNGPLVIQDGKPTTQVDDENLWGRTISTGVATWRSGLAISADGKTLYYFAGPSLSIHTLSVAMMAVHPAAAVQLDINNYWVHFTRIHIQNGQASVDALYPEMMNEHKDRYLYAYPRDFFYITSVH